MKTVIAGDKNYYWRIVSITEHRSCPVDCVCRKYKLQHRDVFWLTVRKTNSVDQVNYWKQTYNILPV